MKAVNLDEVAKKIIAKITWQHLYTPLQEGAINHLMVDSRITRLLRAATDKGDPDLLAMCGQFVRNALPKLLESHYDNKQLELKWKEPCVTTVFLQLQDEKLYLSATPFMPFGRTDKDIREWLDAFQKI